MSKSSDATYVCIKSFNARLGDELSLVVGDRLEILADDSEYNDGWYMGRNVVTNAVGLFPKSFTKVEAVSDNAPSLLRSRSRRVITGGSAKSNASTSNLSTPKMVQHPTNDVHSTLDDIDKALQELQLSPLDPSKSAVGSASNASHQRNPSNSSSYTQDLNPTKVMSWTPKQVSSYFAIVLGFDMDIAGKFARHKITGQILFQLDLAHLKELEIDSFGTRFEIYKEIEKLKQVYNRAHSSSKLDVKDASYNSPGSNSSPMANPGFNNSDDSHLILEDQNIDAKLAGTPSSSRKPSKHQSQSFLLPSADFRASQNDVSPRDVSNGSGVSTHRRTRSRSLDNIHSLAPPNIENSVFTNFDSPRRAPEPPTSAMNSFKFGGSPNVTKSPKPPTNVLRKDSTNRPNSPSVSSRPASSVYDMVSNSHRRKGSAGANSHRRHSSVFSFLSGNNDELADVRLKEKTRASHGDITMIGDAIDIDEHELSPRKASRPEDLGPKTEDNPQKIMKSLKSVSTQNFRNLTVSKKQKSSAYTEGICEINPDDAIKSSNFSGWMSKKSGSTLGWRSRYFTLHGTRLSYFTSLRDKREKGLIDITAHKVLPISTEGDSNSSNDKYIALYASSTGFGRYCFKLVPPAPGFKKGLTFTQPKTHYFAVETQEEMRGWIKALMTATIDIDDTVPIVSSCNTPTVTLAKAQELLAKAREETKMKDEELRAKGFFRDGDTQEESFAQTFYTESVTSEEISPMVGSLNDTTISSSITGNSGNQQAPKLTVDTQTKSYRTPTTPQASMSSGGFASPYILASGMLSPKPNVMSPGALSSVPDEGTLHPSPSVRNDYFGDIAEESISQNSKPTSGEGVERDSTSGSNSSLSKKEKKRSTGEKLMAYTNDGSFVIRSKKK